MTLIVYSFQQNKWSSCQLANNTLPSKHAANVRKIGQMVQTFGGEKYGENQDRENIFDTPMSPILYMTTSTISANFPPTPPNSAPNPRNNPRNIAKISSDVKSRTRTKTNPYRKSQDNTKNRKFTPHSNL